MKTIIYVKTLEEAELKAKQFSNQNVQIVVITDEIAEAFQNKLTNELAIKDEAKLKAHREFQKFNYSRESSKRSQLKMKLFGSYLVSDKDFEELVVQIIKEEVVSKNT